VFSTHDRRVMNMADRLVRIEDGEIKALGMRQSDGWMFVQDRRAQDEEDPEI
jgi:putative ABC transport system ATP-binding protein